MLSPARKVRQLVAFVSYTVRGSYVQIYNMPRASLGRVRVSLHTIGIEP